MREIPKLTVRGKLAEYLFNTHKAGTDYFVAKTLLNKVHEFPNVTVDEIAYIANTTPATVSKFCKKLGYIGFTELINDKSNYTDVDETLFSNFYKNSRDHSIDTSVNLFLDDIHQLSSNMFQQFNVEQMHRIAQQLDGVNAVTIFSGLHGFAATSLFAELLMYFNITTYEIERNSEIEIIRNAIDSAELIFVISLTEKWIQDILYQNHFSKAQLKKMIVLTYSDEVQDDFNEVVVFADIEHFFTSSYISSNALQSFFIMLTAYLSKIRNRP